MVESPLQQIREIFETFFERAPFLCWGLHFLLGAAWALEAHFIYLLPTLLLLLFSHRLFQGLVFLLIGFLVTCYNTPSKDLPEGQIEGKGIFRLESIHPSYSPFHQSTSFKGTLLGFAHEGKLFHHLPCIITLDQNTPVQKRGSCWLIEGTLVKKSPFHTFLKPKKEAPWKQVPSRGSLAKRRFASKEKVRKILHKKVQDKHAAHLLASLSTGDVDGELLKMEFQKLGLGHLLAISGFHFALIAGALQFCLRKVFPQLLCIFLLLGAISSYFLFLGFSPSVMRAFVMMALYLIGLLLKRRLHVLNFLGVALLVELAFSPLSLINRGFALSFLATLGIILFYEPSHTLLKKVFPKRPLKEVLSMSSINQYGYLASCGLRRSLALSLALLITTLPLSLYLFHSFSLLSFFYNLFIPLLLSVSILALPLGFFLPPLLKLNVLYTSFVLKPISNPPELLNFKFYFNDFPFSLLIFCITAALFLGMFLKVWIEKNNPGS